jgi:hypothetical protein
VSDGEGRDLFGSALGALVFLLGVGLLGFTFYLAADLFSTPPRELIDKNTSDVTQIGIDFGHVFLRIGLLLVMSIVGSVISGKGVRMYLASRTLSDKEKTEI